MQGIGLESVGDEWRKLGIQFSLGFVIPNQSLQLEGFKESEVFYLRVCTLFWRDSMSPEKVEMSKRVWGTYRV